MARQAAHELILCLAAVRRDVTAVERLCRGRIDWERVLALCERHRVVPLVYKALAAMPTSVVERAVVQRFQARYRDIGAAGFVFACQALHLAEVLARRGIPVLAYKGPALAAYAYGDVTLRQFSDIDLFVRQGDVGAVKTLFAALGWRPDWSLTPDQEAAVLADHYEYPLRSEMDGVLLELHWHFTEPFFAFDFATDALWDRATTADIRGRRIPTLSGEDALIVLCAHGSKHLWPRLNWICDVAMLAENGGISWGEVVARASRYDALRMVRLGLHLAVTLLGLELPATFRQDLVADREATALAERVAGRLFNDDVREQGTWFEMALTHLRLRERFGTKARYAGRLLATKAVDSLSLPLGRPR